MTGVDEKKPPVDRSPASKLAGPLRPYADIFRIPGAWRFSAAGVIGRMPMAMFGLGTVLLISAATGKYGMAGVVSAVGSLGYAFSSPRIARLVDTRGQRRVLLPLLTVFAMATTALIVTVELKLPTWAFFAPGAIAAPVSAFEGCTKNASFTGVVTVKPALVAAVDRALAFKKDDRWQSARAMFEALRAAYGELTDAGPPSRSVDVPISFEGDGATSLVVDVAFGAEHDEVEAVAEAGEVVLFDFEPVAGALRGLIARFLCVQHLNHEALAGGLHGFVEEGLDFFDG